MKKFGFFVFFLAVFTACAASAFALVIDDFVSPAFYSISSYDGLTQTRTDLGLASVLGGSRQIDAQFGPYGMIYGDRIRLIPDQADSGGTGFLELNSNPDDFNSFQLTYDNGGLGLGADFSGRNSVSVLFAVDHFGLLKNTVLSMTLKDDALNTATQTKTWTTTWITIGPWVYTQEDFLLSAFAGIDLSHLRSIQLYFEGDYSNDVRFTLIQTADAQSPTAIPEPAGLLLFAAGFFATRTRLLKRK